MLPFRFMLSIRGCTLPSDLRPFSEDTCEWMIFKTICEPFVLLCAPCRLHQLRPAKALSRLYTPLCGPSHAVSPDAPKVSESRVLIIGTGGTIAMVDSPKGLVPAKDLLQTHLRPRPSLNDSSLPPAPPLTSREPDGDCVITEALRTPLSRHQRRILYTVQEFSPLLDSSSMASPSWNLISSCIENNYDLFDGFVILHGTDSLAYSASALSFILSAHSKPIILTGSQAPFSQLHTDAMDNLLGALLLAGHYSIPEVTLFFANTLYRGNRATKVSATAFAAFDSPNFPPLAKIDATGMHISWNLLLPPPAATAEGLRSLIVRPTLDTGHVACLRLFPGIQAAMLDAVIRVKPIVGLILETFGMGNAPLGEDGAIMKVLADAVQRDVVIVSVTQCLSGSVDPVYAPGRTLMELGIVPGGDLTSEAALTKLAWLMGGSLSTAEVREQMGRSLKGEMSISLAQEA